MTTNSRGHLSSETIDLLSMAALPPQEADSAQHHLQGCESCKTRWHEALDDRQHFEQFVFARTLPKVEAATASLHISVGQRFRWLIPMLGLAAAGVALVLASAGLFSRENDSYVGLKGASPSFTVFAMGDEGRTFEVKPGQALKPRDRIRFVVNPAGAKYLLVASRDAAGAFTVYHPYGAAESARLDDSVSAAKSELSTTIELDEVTGPEHLVAVFSNAPVEAEDVAMALAANETSPTLPNAKVVSYELVKEAP